MNYGVTRTDLPTVEEETPVVEPKRRRMGRLVGIIMCVCGLCVVCGSVALMMPNWTSQSEIENAASEFKFDADDIQDKANDAAVNEDPSGKSVDWNKLKSFNEHAEMWIEVEGKDIDFPVLQGDDNEWYLYHDIYGKRTYCSVFADYRADPDGRNVIVYGHTLIGGGMFTPLSRMSHQSDFNTLGEVYYSTPNSGTRAYTPIAAISVTPDYQGVQEFEWKPDQVLIQEEYDKILREKELAGEYNVTRSVSEESDPSVEKFISMDQSTKIPQANYYVLTEEDKKSAYEAAELHAYRNWLYATVKDYSAKRSDWKELIDRADSSVVLACCSWPFNNHRTIIVCVRGDWENQN